MSDTDVDLGGRPEFEVTDEKRIRVERYISCGMSQEDAARAIGCSEPTLMKHFEDNVLNGRARRRAQLIDLMFGNAEKGNASVQKHLSTIIGIETAAAAFDAPERPQKLGKKEEANKAASTAGIGTSWGDDLATPNTLN